ncbi:MAG: DUF2147 domain-containing protein [Phycisphaerales bacterium]|nr:DUF2147 domain-containing protein [Phycisphaerales bacterium]
MYCPVYRKTILHFERLNISNNTINKYDILLNILHTPRQPRNNKMIAIRNTILLLICWLTTSYSAFSILPRKSVVINDAINGFYWIDKNTQIKIYRNTVGTYNGQIIFMHDSINPKTHQYKLDNNNHATNLRSRRLLGLIIISNLKFNAIKKDWEDGKIYNPKDGLTYGCYIEQKDQNNICLTAYLYLKIFQGTVCWKKQ